ncbi:hypothetical protein DSCO28_71050 [Desulfosarcina ovata subsp. sediminis]|uniref:Uncharacterized protein n=1 Tax=Desulfosarcina ovata subsp. sediminis TaxID=885957 RepID=A0A5K8A1V1_9BACT|nr:hypothetical protein [Desulfosarcina ovata]BBO86539.1 hypothetical protein DSCO28_71050 [Desulfosarcina ovata subsp. sediminis]
MHLTKEARNKIGLMVFGMTLFPAMVHGLGKWFMDSSVTISGFYTYFFRSLLDTGKDGMVVWSIACGPYMFYELVLLYRSFFPGTRSRVPGKPECEN